VDVNMLSTSGAPIELAAIAEGFTINNAIVNRREVTLIWETKTEANSYKFEIDRALVSTNSSPLTSKSI
jgi:hypothetical protein